MQCHVIGNVALSVTQLSVVPAPSLNGLLGPTLRYPFILLPFHLINCQRLGLFSTTDNQTVIVQATMQAIAVNIKL